METTLPRREIVLLGIGHTNAHVVRMWRMHAMPETRLTCVSNFAIATYSGMLPAALAGQIPPQRMQIDLVRLCASAGARLLIDEVVGIDRHARQIHLRDRPSISYDALSIGIGSVPAPCLQSTDGPQFIPIKPMQTFLPRVSAGLQAMVASDPQHPRIAVVGGGVGGIEISLCIQDFVKQTLGANVVARITVVDAHERIPRGMSVATQQRIRRTLASRDIEIQLQKRVVRVSPGQMEFADGTIQAVDLVLWAAGAIAPPLLYQLDLPQDERGFLKIRDTLQSVDDARVFAVGDAGTIEQWHLPKAGVYAVRQGPVLWHNLQALVAGRPLRYYVPQRRFLKLINTGDGRAIGDYAGLSFQGTWVRRWKDRIDGRFIDKYQDYPPPMTVMPSASSTADAPMRCAGCGSKVSASVLRAVLDRLQQEIPLPGEGMHVERGLDRPTDVAIIATPSSRIAVTTDFFRAPLPDHYLAGRLAALNALSDVHTLNARGTAAVAHVMIPAGPAHRQEVLLYELLQGGLRELSHEQVPLVGGHTVEGPEVVLGFTIIAEPSPSGDFAPRPMQPGDAIVLTKPLGTGALLAALMRAQCRAAWMQTLLESMLRSNRLPDEAWHEFQIREVTDVTGFGLAGHGLELWSQAGVDVEVELRKVPLLPGFAQLVTEGIESTLAPANRQWQASLSAAPHLRELPEYAALFDPQTSGGLLVVLPEQHVDAFVTRLADAGQQAVRIGQIMRTRPLPPTPWTATMKLY